MRFKISFIGFRFKELKVVSFFQFLRGECLRPILKDLFILIYTQL